MSTQKKTVLIADNQLRWREFAKNRLADDYRVETVNDCESVIARIKQGGVDLLVLDFLMPGEEPFGTGYDVALHLRRELPKLPVIFYTSAWFDQNPDRQDLEKKTGTTVVFKEVRDPKLDDLKTRVQELLG